MLTLFARLNPINMDALHVTSAEQMETFDPK